MTTTNGSVGLYMSTSLDGYIAGPDDPPGQELGDGVQTTPGLQAARLRLGVTKGYSSAWVDTN